MSHSTQKRFENTARSIISEYCSEHDILSHADFGMIHIGDIRISKDRSYLDISVSSFKNTENLTKYMAEFAHNIHQKLGKQLQTYKIPRIRFRYDASGSIGTEVTRTIDTLK